MLNIPPFAPTSGSSDPVPLVPTGSKNREGGGFHTIFQSLFGGMPEEEPEALMTEGEERVADTPTEQSNKPSEDNPHSPQPSPAADTDTEAKASPQGRFDTIPPDLPPSGPVARIQTRGYAAQYSDHRPGSLPHGPTAAQNSALISSEPASMPTKVSPIAQAGISPANVPPDVKPEKDLVVSAHPAKTPPISTLQRPMPVPSTKGRPAKPTQQDLPVAGFQQDQPLDRLPGGGSAPLLNQHPGSVGQTSGSVFPGAQLKPATPQSGKDPAALHSDVGKSAGVTLLPDRPLPVAETFVPARSVNPVEPSFGKSPLSARTGQNFTPWPEMPRATGQHLLLSPVNNTVISSDSGKITPTQASYIVKAAPQQTAAASPVPTAPTTLGTQGNIPASTEVAVSKPRRETGQTTSTLVNMARTVREPTPTISMAHPLLPSDQPVQIPPRTTWTKPAQMPVAEPTQASEGPAPTAAPGHSLPATNIPIQEIPVQTRAKSRGENTTTLAFSPVKDRPSSPFATRAISPLASPPIATDAGVVHHPTFSEDPATLVAPNPEPDDLPLGRGEDSRPLSTSGITTRSESVFQRPETPITIARQLTEKAQNAQTRMVELSLSPQELGRVRMSLATNNEAIVVTIATERPETLALMRRHIDQLAQDFQNIGYSNVSFSFESQGGNDKEQHQDRSAPFLSTEAAESPPPEKPSSQQPAPRSGLDIRI